MRRIDLHPKRKLKNPARHLRSLKRWSETVHLSLPEHVSAESRFLNIKLAVYSKLCDPPHTKPEFQRACLEALITVARNIRAHVKRDRAYKLAILFQTPYMHGSEVTLFFDMDYLRSFFPPTTFGVAENDICRVTTIEPQREQVDRLALTIPLEFEFLGGYRMIEEDKEPGGQIIDNNHWIIVER